jgi:hypothetical protein
MTADRADTPSGCWADAKRHDETPATSWEWADIIGGLWLICVDVPRHVACPAKVVSGFAMHVLVANKAAVACLATTQG